MEIFFSVSHNGSFVFRTDIYVSDSYSAARAEEALRVAFGPLAGYTIERNERPSAWTSTDVTAVAAVAAVVANVVLNVTPLEAQALNCIARNSYQPTNYGVPEKFEDTSSIWSHSITDADAKFDGAKKSLPGVIASLSKKGLVDVTEDGKDTTVALTRDGFATWQANFPDAK